MSEIVIRRYQGDESHSSSEIMIRPTTDGRKTAAQLRGILRTEQQERGTGVWSDADPEVLVGDALVGRVHGFEDIDGLVKTVLDILPG